MFSIDSRSRVPIYEQLGQNIISLVASGALDADDQLPSVRTLARELGVNPNTVQKAYSEMESKGILYQAAGRGSFVAPTEALMHALAEQRVAALAEPLREAKRSGVAKERVILLVEKIYGGDDDND
ncbi:MAG: GntR family transcriptional regulator [Oscillospiraceae bacterium]